MRPNYEWLRDHLESATRDVAAWPAWKRNEIATPMTQQDCVLLITDWFEMRGIKADAAALAAWLYVGGDRVGMPSPSALAATLKESHNAMPQRVTG